MERLTERLTDKSYCISDIRAIQKETFYEDMECRRGFDLYTGKAIDKLAEYEDLEEQNRLIKLSCAVGDTIYHVCIPKNDEPQIIEMKVGCVEPYGAVRNYKGTCEVWNIYAETDYTKAYFKFFDFEKTVFLTREEAEAALEELERG